MRRRRNSTQAREQWYAFHRWRRILFRELAKAWADTILFGTGVVAIEPDQVKHVPLQEVIFAPSTETIH